VAAGSESDEPVSSIDILPTIAEAADASLPGDRPIDGVSLVGHLKAAGAEPLERDELIWHFPHYRHAPGPYSIIRKGDWKLIKYYEGISELYNLGEDLGEADDLAESMPDKVRELDAQLMDALRAMNAKIPRLNPLYQAAGK
jgi:arylsulfatase A-like enzyme